MTTIANPKVSRAAGAYRFDFGQHVAVVVSRVNLSRNTLRADVLVKAAFPGLSPFSLRDTPDLRSAASKAALVRSLAGGVQEVPWAEVVETVAETVITSELAGPEVISLVDVPQQERIAHRLYPFLHEKESTVIFGPGGTLKSLLSDWMAVRIVWGIDDAEPGPVLFLDGEWNEYAKRDRIAMVSEGVGIGTHPEIYYRHMHHHIADDIESLAREVADKGIQFVVIDSAAYAAGGEPEKAEAVIRVYSALNSLQVTSLIIGHVTNDKDSKRPFGSVFWVNAARSVYEVKRTTSEDSNVVDIGLYHRKSNSSRLQRPRGFRVTFNQSVADQYTEGDSITFDPLDVRDSAELAQHLPLRDQIAAALRDGARSASWIAEHLDKDEAQIRARLTDAQGKRKFTRLPDATWGLVEVNRS